MWGRLFFLPWSNFQLTYIAGAQGGGAFLGVAMLGGDSFCMDDCLGMEDPFGEDVFPKNFSLHALGATSQFYPCSFLRTSNI